MLRADKPTLIAGTRGRCAEYMARYQLYIRRRSYLSREVTRCRDVQAILLIALLFCLRREEQLIFVVLQAGCGVCDIGLADEGPKAVTMFSLAAEAIVPLADLDYALKCS